MEKLKRIIVKLKMDKAYRALRIVVKNPIYAVRALKGIRRNGLRWAIDKARGKVLGQSMSKDYVYVEDRLDMEKELAALSRRPMISVVMPVYNVEVKWLDIALMSVLTGSYDNFEICIVDDCSTDPALVKYLAGLRHEKIRVVRNESNLRISETSNRGVAMARGEFIALMDNDDLYNRNALFYIAKAISEEEPDVLYTDEDKVDVSGVNLNPFFKPDWSPDLLRSQMYLGHIFAFRKSLFEEVGGFRKEFDGAQDYDLALRMSEATKKICHIQKVLYSWREIPTSTAMNPDSKPYAHLAGLKALDGHLKRVYGEGAHADETEHYYVYDARYPLDREKTMVSVIIPTKDKVELLEPCVRSILEKTSYENYEILILDNNSELEETFNWFREIEKDERIHVVKAPFAFNWSKLNNVGIREAKGDVFIFLNNDTLVISEDWMDRLAEKALRDDVGTVGARLLYEDNTIQHAGVVIGLGGWADHVFKNGPQVHYGTPYVSPVLTRNVIANTGACMAVSRKTIDRIGAFSEDFIICGSDVELGIRAYKQGLFNVYDAGTMLYHLESKSRDSYIPQVDFDMSKIHYMEFLENGDPFYNRNLDLDSTSPRVR